MRYNPKLLACEESGESQLARNQQNQQLNDTNVGIIKDIKTPIIGVLTIIYEVKVNMFKVNRKSLRKDTEDITKKEMGNLELKKP